MKMISPSNRAVDVGQTLSEKEYIGMCRREVRGVAPRGPPRVPTHPAPVFALPATSEDTRLNACP